MRPILLLPLLLLAAFASLGSTQVTCPSIGGNSCDNLGSCITYASSNSSYCACRSGSAGVDCGTNVSSSCPFTSVSLTSTSNIPIAVLASYSNDQLSVSVKSPLVLERIYSTVAVDDSVADNANCTYPGKYWSRAFDGCNDKFYGVMPWAETNSCGWTLDNSDSEYFTYSSQMTIQHHDLIDPFGGRAGQAPVERLTQHVVPLQVQFQKSIDVSSTITVQSPVRLLVAVTRQEVTADTKNAIIEVTTNLLFPYKFTTEQLTLVPSALYPGMNFSIIEIGDQTLCPNSAGSPCTQVFRINIEIGGNCQITGNYQIAWSLACQLDAISGKKPASCAIDASASSSASISILSEDFCAKVSVKVQIAGNLNSFDSNTYLSPKTQFIVNQSTYFRADLSSSDATLQSSVVRSVKLVSGSEPTILLYSDGSAPISEANFQLAQSGADFAQFFFTLKDSYITGIAVDSSKTYAVTARIDVTFVGVPGVKRLVLQGSLNNKPMALSAQIGIAAPLQQQQPSHPGLENGSTAIAPLSGAFAIIATGLLLD